MRRRMMVNKGNIPPEYREIIGIMYNGGYSVRIGNAHYSPSSHDAVIVCDFIIYEDTEYTYNYVYHRSISNSTSSFSQALLYVKDEGLYVNNTSAINNGTKILDISSPNFFGLHHIEHYLEYVVIDGQKVNVKYSTSNGFNFNNVLVLFDSVNFRSGGKACVCKISDEWFGNVEHEYIACIRKSDDEYGFYDSISKSFTSVKSSYTLPILE